MTKEVTRAGLDLLMYIAADLHDIKVYRRKDDAAVVAIHNRIVICADGHPETPFAVYRQTDDDEVLIARYPHAKEAWAHTENEAK